MTRTMCPRAMARFRVTPSINCVFMGEDDARSQEVQRSVHYILDIKAHEGTVGFEWRQLFVCVDPLGNRLREIVEQRELGRIRGDTMMVPLRARQLALSNCSGPVFAPVLSGQDDRAVSVG